MPRLSTWILFALTSLLSLQAAPLTLVRDGQPAAAIVLPASPTKAAQLAAFELQHHVQLITGATLPIGAEAPATGVSIYLGDTQAAKAAGLVQASFGPQEYVVQVGANSILLVGRDAADTEAPVYKPELPRYDKLPGFWDERGTLDATYDFLEQACGVHWLNSSEFGTSYVPRQTLTIDPLTIRRQPSFSYRDGLASSGDNPYLYSFGGYWPRKSIEMEEYKQAAFPMIRQANENDKTFDAVVAQCVRLHMLRWRNGGTIQRCNHSLYGYYKRFWDDPKTRRPEFFAQGFDGKPPQLCYTNPELIAQVAADAAAYYDTNTSDIFWQPKAPNWFPVEPMDNRNFCHCDNCQKLLSNDFDPEKASYSNGEHSDYFFNFVNEVAKALHKTHPDKNVVTLAYSSHAAVPTKITLDPSVAVQFCMPSNRQAFQQDKYDNEMQLLREWSQEGTGRPLYMWLYDGFPISHARNRNFHCWPGVYSATLAEQMKAYHELGVQGFFMCGLPQDIDNYLLFRYMSDADLDLAAEQDAYYQGLYGAAAKPIHAFYDIVEKRYQELGNGLDKTVGIPYTDEVFKQLADLVSQAESLADSDRAKANLKLFKMGIWAYMQEGMAERQRLASAPVPELDVPSVPAAAGDVQSVDWEKAADMGSWHDNNSLDVTERQLSGRIAHDDTHLYIELVDTCETAKLTSVGAIFPFDTWEVFVADQSGYPVRQYAFNPDGVSKLISHGEVNFRMNVAMPENPMVVTSDTTDPARWVSRLAIPLDSITQAGIKPGGTFYLNVGRVWSYPPLLLALWGPMTNLREMERAPKLTLK